MSLICWTAGLLWSVAIGDVACVDTSHGWLVTGLFEDLNVACMLIYQIILLPDSAILCFFWHMNDVF